MPRPLTIEDVRRMIHKKVHRDLGVPLREIAETIKRHGLTYDEFLQIADVMIQSFDVLEELKRQSKKGGIQ